MNAAAPKSPAATVLSLAQLLPQQPSTPPPCLVEPGLLPPQGILFVGGEPKVGKSLLVANLALSLAAGSDRLGFPVPAPRRVLVCQFELPVPQFVSRLATMRRAMGSAADQNLFVDTRAPGHLLNAPQGLQHFLSAAHAAAAEILILDPLYSTHDQDENDTRAMAALGQSLLRLREASRAALIVVHHVRKSIGRYEIGSAFRGSSALLPSATAISCSRDLRLSSTPSNSASSFVMQPRSRRACWSSIPPPCGSRRPARRRDAPQAREGPSGIKSNQPMCGRR
jgi:AAA domain